MADLSIGERIAVHRRRRGLSQSELAGQLGRSVQWLSNLERGVRPADRYAILVPIAERLGVPVTELTGDLPTSHDETDRQNAVVQRIRLALTGHVFIAGVMEPAAIPDVPSIDELRVRAEAAWVLVHEARYEELGELLPELVADVERAAWRADEPESWRLAALTYQAVAAVMAKLGGSDGAWVAADRSAFAAARAGDGLLAAAGDFRLGHAFLSSGRPDQAERAASVAIAALEPAARAGDAEALTLWGALNLVRAVAAARDGDREVAMSALADADEAVARLDGRCGDRFETEFGAQNVAVHAVSVAVELGDAGLALRRASCMDPVGLSAERRARLLVDVARAHAQQRQAGAAVDAIVEAERLAPEMVRCHRLVRETVGDLVRRGRSRPRPEVQALARRLHVV
jgi:transcriptional regulator with XRE-family HTH domain